MQKLVLKTRQARSMIAIATLLALAGCAAAGTGVPTGDTILIVENDLVPSTSVSVYVVEGEDGPRQLVGLVDPGATATLRFDPISAGAEYHFVAERTDGPSLVSNPVVFSPGETIRWDLTTNFANVLQ